MALASSSVCPLLHAAHWRQKRQWKARLPPPGRSNRFRGCRKWLRGNFDLFYDEFSGSLSGASSNLAWWGLLASFCKPLESVYNNVPQRVAIGANCSPRLRTPASLVPTESFPAARSLIHTALNLADAGTSLRLCDTNFLVSLQAIISPVSRRQRSPTSEPDLTNDGSLHGLSLVLNTSTCCYLSQCRLLSRDSVHDVNTPARGMSLSLPAAIKANNNSLVSFTACAGL
jgi:hypothetical protein